MGLSIMVNVMAAWAIDQRMVAQDDEALAMYG
jgi:hypothetical protein